VTSPASPAASEQPGAPCAPAPASPDSSHGNPLLNRAIPLPLKVFGVLAMLSGVVVVVTMALLVVMGVQAFLDERLEIEATVLVVLNVALQLALGVLYFLLGVRLIKNRRRASALTARAVMVLLVCELLVGAMLTGVSGDMLTSVMLIGIMVVLQGYLDPALADERKLNRKLRRLDAAAAEEARLEHLRRAKGNEPYQLNYFNVFWTFVICCVLGLLIETVYHFVVYGGYQNRTGMLWGPFSPIYGFGAVLMTLALNRLRDKNVLVIFLGSAVIGGAFEFFVSWFLQYAFGITAWDYSGSFMSIGGRTNAMFMFFWGVLGVAWVKLLMPWVFKLIYLIPWDWRYGVTTAATVFMLVNGAMTLQALDCWYERANNQPIETNMQEFFARHYGNEFMEHRFQTMSMDASESTRVQR